jgi:predicted transcriptional regulator
MAMNSRKSTSPLMLSRELHALRDLFQREFKVVRISKKDAAGRSDHFASLRSLLVTNEISYPSIGKWIKEKVVPGLLSGERIAYVGYENDKPVASAIVKLGESTKFCHLKLADDFQDLNLGEVFFALMAVEALGHAKEVHFTLPESLWQRRNHFFQSFGFPDALPAQIQYRLFEQELRCSASFAQVWNAARIKLPKLLRIFGNLESERQLLMSLKPTYAARILGGQKTVEIRRRFADKWLGHRVSLYASAPVQSLVGEAKISAVTSGHPSAIWEKFGPMIGGPKEEFDHYVAGASEVYAIVLEDVISYASGTPISQMSDFVGRELVPPQSYRSLQASDSWAQAVSIVTMLSQKSTFRNAK